LVALDSVFEEGYLQQQYTTPFLELTTIDGHVYGVPHLANLKGLIWYPKEEFEAAGYEVPHTWDEVMALSQEMVADGRIPWCIGIEDGDASGWIGTDWVEALLLRTAPPEVYDAWTEGDLPFDSPEIRRVFELMEPIWLNDDYVYGGTASIAETFVLDAADPMFQEPPGCFFLNGATFSPVLFPQDLVYGQDYDFFVLPAIDPEYGQPLLGSGNLYAMFNDRPEVREVMRYLTNEESIKLFAETGISVSSHRNVPLEWYATPRQLRYAQLIAEADVYRFDGSDLVPGEVGFQFWQGIVDWVEGRDLDTILQEIDDSWQGELEQPD
jgi:alpha-glucoside transport system substrate-binding protein